MEIFKVLEIIERKTTYDRRLEYQVTNGKYIKYIDREEFLKGETILSITHEPKGSGLVKAIID